METVFSMWFVPRCYKQESLKQRVRPVLIEDLCVVQKEEFSNNMLYV
jgi:hypothetical protein